MKHCYRLFFLDHSIFCQLSQHIITYFPVISLSSTHLKHVQSMPTIINGFFFVNVLLYFSFIDDKISTSDGYLPVQDKITSKCIIVHYSGCWLVCSTVILLAVTCCCKNPIASQSAQPFLETLKGRKGGAEKTFPLSMYYSENAYFEVCLLFLFLHFCQ